MRTFSLSLCSSLFVALAVASGCGGDSFSEGDDDASAGDGGSRAGATGTSGAGSGGRAGAAGGAGAAGRAGNGGSGQAGSSAGAAGDGGDAGSTSGRAGGAGTESGAGGMIAGAAGVGGSAGATGGGGAGVTCDDPDQSISVARQGAQTRTTAVGMNGSFTDECDDAGDLTEYICATTCNAAAQRAAPAGSSGIGIPCLPEPTGYVTSVTIICSGQCKQGTCFSHCPNYEDTFTVTTIDAGRVVLTGTDDDSLYDCFPTEGADPFCTSTELLGDKVKVAALGTCDATQAVIGVVPAEATEPTCAYSCSVPIASSR